MKVSHDELREGQAEGIVTTLTGLLLQTAGITPTVLIVTAGFTLIALVVTLNPHLRQSRI